MGNIKIGNHILRHGLMLAPMAGVTDRAFRHVCRVQGAEYTVSEMVSSKALVYEQKSHRNDKLKTAPLAAVLSDELPMAIQIFGSEPDFMAEAARLLCSCEYKGFCGNSPPTAIDINMGCPVQKITSNGEGSALMRDIPKAAEIVQAVVRAVNIPVTVKIRAGWSSKEINAPEFAKAMEQAGASLICIHARTKEQMYGAGTDWNIIRLVKESVSVPVVGNGDIRSADDALKMIEQTGCDGVAVGRYAQGNPWIFGQICDALDGNPQRTPSADEIFDTALAQVREMLTYKSDRVANAEAKKHLAWYTHNFRASAGIREKIMLASSYPEYEEILLSFRQWLKDRGDIT